MSALLEPAGADRKRAHSDRLRIDYVVCNRRCDVVAVVDPFAVS
jgi:hypothetical protein